VSDEAPDVTHCDGCGQDDDHPKGHWWGNWVKETEGRETTVIANPSFHFDCTPQEYLDMWGDAPQHARSMGAVEAAKSGIHGNELRAHIRTLPDDNLVGQE